MLSEGNKLYSVSGADNLGTSASSTGANVQVDNTGPSLTTVIAATTGTSPQGFVKQGGTYRVYANATDLPSGSGNSSGVNAATLTANVSTVTAGQTAVALTACGACGPSSAYAYQSAQLTADVVLSEGNKLYSVSGADNLGTSASSSGANVQVDNTAPTVAAVIANTTTNEPGWLAQGSGYRVYANVTELPSGSGSIERRQRGVDHGERLERHDRADGGRADDERLPVHDRRHDLRVSQRGAHLEQPALGRKQELHGQRERQSRNEHDARAAA